MDRFIPDGWRSSSEEAGDPPEMSGHAESGGDETDGSRDRESDPIEPGHVSRENAAFVVLGAILAILIGIRLVTLV